MSPDDFGRFSPMPERLTQVMERDDDLEKRAMAMELHDLRRGARRSKAGEERSAEAIAKAVAPLLERLDAAEEDAKVYREEVAELEEKLRVAAHNKDEMRYDDAKRRFRAGLAVELLQNYPMGLNDEDRERAAIENALGMVDAVLKKVGL